jgi:hypothetical protein
VDLRTTISATAVATLAILTSLTIFQNTTQEDDATAAARIKTATQRAPNVAYPEKDIKGRNIRPFDYLVVFPDCTSCSDFRIKAAEFMNSRPDLIFLVLTPDLKNMDHILEKPRYFVVQYKQDSVYSKIDKGFYAK